MVDMDACELFSDRFYEKCGDHGGVDPSGQCEEDTLVPNLLAKCGYLFVYEFPGELRCVDPFHGFGAFLCHLFVSFAVQSRYRRDGHVRVKGFTYYIDDVERKTSDFTCLQNC